MKCIEWNLFEYLASFPMDNYEWSWVRASKVVEDTGISREELWEIIQENKTEDFLDCIAMNLPGAEGLLSVTITKRGRLWLKGEDYSHIPCRPEKIYNLLLSKRRPSVGIEVNLCMPLRATGSGLGLF